jgi:glycosyltransferase involved in cell wall biosynthesis
MKITVTGHSLIHPRQHMLFSHMSAIGLAEVQVISPSRWGSEQCAPVSVNGYEHVCLESVGASFLSYRLRGLEEAISDFNPDILYVMEEPYTPFALRCSKIAEEHAIPMVIFTWENVLDRRFGERNDKIEAEVIAKAAILVAGNESAKKRLINKGAAEDNIAVCPQTGISTDIFKPMPDVEKTYDCAYFGRMVKEKGIEYIERVVKDLKLKMLWGGGRGDMAPSYGNYIGWIDYLRLPEYYNKTKLFVTYPYAYNGYSEQMNFSIGEAMACGLPVITSTNGSIGEVYKEAPVAFAAGANVRSLKIGLQYAQAKSEEWEKDSVKWVHGNLSLDAIAHRLLKILKAV